MKYLPPLNPSAVHPSDQFLIVNPIRKQIVESAGSMLAANDAAQILNQHEQRNGRPCIYKVIHKNEQI